MYQASVNNFVYFHGYPHVMDEGINVSRNLY